MPASIQTFAVEGMSCQGCASSIEKALAKRPRVDSANVDLAAKTLRVEGDIPAADVIKAVDDLGFTAQLQAQS